MEVTASYWEDQRLVLAAVHKKLDLTRLTQDGGCHYRKPWTNLGKKDLETLLSAPSNKYSTLQLTAFKKR